MLQIQYEKNIKFEKITNNLNDWICQRPWINKLIKPNKSVVPSVFSRYNDGIQCNWRLYNLENIGTKEQLLTKIQSKLIGEHIYKISFDDGEDYFYIKDNNTWELNNNVVIPNSSFNSNTFIGYNSNSSHTIQSHIRTTNTLKFGVLEISVDDSNDVKILNTATNKSRIINLEDNNNSSWNSTKNMFSQIKTFIKNLFRNTK